MNVNSCKRAETHNKSQESNSGNIIYKRQESSEGKSKL